MSEQEKTDLLLHHFIQCAGTGDGGLVLQKIHYWLSQPNSAETDKQGRRYVSDTIKSWQKDHFFWLSIDQLGRLFQKLEKMGLIETTRAFNTNPFDRKKWYTLNYAKIKIDASIKNRFTRNDKSDHKEEV